MMFIPALLSLLLLREELELAIGGSCFTGHRNPRIFATPNLTMHIMKKLKLKTVEDIIYFAGKGRESLLIKVRGRGWFISSGGNDDLGLTPTRMRAWLLDDTHSFERLKVQHFHFEPPKGGRHQKPQEKQANPNDRQAK